MSQVDAAANVVTAIARVSDSRCADAENVIITMRNSAPSNSPLRPTASATGTMTMTAKTSAGSRRHQPAHGEGDDGKHQHEQLDGVTRVERLGDNDDQHGGADEEPELVAARRDLRPGQVSAPPPPQLHATSVRAARRLPRVRPSASFEVVKSFVLAPSPFEKTTSGLIRSLSVAPPATPDGTLRIIEIIGVDRQACGGTHLSNTAASRPFRITKVGSKGKRNRRIRFVLDE